MSRYNISLERLEDNGCFHRFRVFTCDLSLTGDAEDIGFLSIGLNPGEIEFTPSGIWEHQDLLPIATFIHSPDVAKAALHGPEKTKNIDWMHAIYRRAKAILQERIEDDSHR
jgi:hypothetical protein